MRMRQWAEVNDDLRVWAELDLLSNIDPHQKHHPPIRTRGQKTHIK